MSRKSQHENRLADTAITVPFGAYASLARELGVDRRAVWESVNRRRDPAMIQRMAAHIRALRGARMRAQQELADACR